MTDRYNRGCQRKYSKIIPDDDMEEKKKGLGKDKKVYSNCSTKTVKPSKSRSQVENERLFQQKMLKMNKSGNWMISKPGDPFYEGVYRRMGKGTTTAYTKAKKA